MVVVVVFWVANGRGECPAGLDVECSFEVRRLNMEVLRGGVAEAGTTTPAPRTKGIAAGARKAVAELDIVDEFGEKDESVDGLEPGKG